LIELTQDFHDLLVELTDAGADFVLVGGYAVAYHGHPRATKDIDLLIESTAENAARVFKGLVAFGAPLNSIDVSHGDLAGYDGVIQIGLPPNRIDILTRISGVSYEEASNEGCVFDVDGRAIKVIGIEALIRNKRAAARDQDLVDVKALELNRI
jgi:predicted nucleotidyltransferase